MNITEVDLALQELRRAELGAAIGAVGISGAGFLIMQEHLMYELTDFALL